MARTLAGDSACCSTSSTASASPGIKQLVAHVALAGEAQVPAIHQVAGDRLERQEFQHGVGRLVEAVEQQQHAAAMHRQRIDRDRGVGDERERPFAADEQLGQVELAVVEHVVEPSSRCG